MGDELPLQNEGENAGVQGEGANRFSLKGELKSTFLTCMLTHLRP